MVKKKKKSLYWTSPESSPCEDENLDEFPEDVFDVGMARKGRRDFLKIMGFSMSVLPVISSCRKIPKQKAIPYLLKDDQIIPGIANWYASTCGIGPYFNPILVKTREGRPIKIEGNALSPLSLGGTSPSCQASILSLYDSSRYKAPQKKGKYTTFGAVDLEIIQGLKQTKSSGKKVALIIDSVHGPSQKGVIDEFKREYPNTEVIVYNPFGRSVEADSCESAFGVRDTCEYDLGKTDVVIGISHDFLSPGVSPIYLTKQYSKRRDVSVSTDLIKHIQVEGVMSLTGSNADTRFVLDSNQESILINNLLFELQTRRKKKLLDIKKVDFAQESIVKNLAQQLLNHLGRSVIMYGGMKVENALKVHTINELIGAHREIISLSGRDFVQYEDDGAFVKFVEEAKKGKYSHVIFSDVNPAYSYCDPASLQDALKKVQTKISTAGAPDETSVLCDYVAPNRHYLERWDDFEVSSGHYSFSQPVIRSLFNNRPASESLLVWSEKGQDFHKYMKKIWRTKLMKKHQVFDSFSHFWTGVIHDGVYSAKNINKPALKFKLSSSYKFREKLQEGDALHLRVYQKGAMLKGEMANNPWAQEMPDPITKATWDNYLLISPKLAATKKIETGRVLSLTVKGKTFELPALVQAGMSDSVVAVALGYGRKVCGKAGKDVGVNAFPMTAFDKMSFSDALSVEQLKATGKTYDLALTQTHNSLEGRDIIKETTLGEYKKNPAAGNEHGVHLYSMWKDHKKDGHQWGMAIDLNKCTGCSGCIVSCNAENNVPVVGKEEVHNRREMHWLRIDRYYKGDSGNPEVVHQPMTCQHCDNAPCETVCPTLATVQSSEGLNQQVYNRCVGTRYCANNCPYKVRRFNWFDYGKDAKLENMVLNPDITVRSRGVMEKCTMCVHRIQEKRIEAKNKGVELKGDDIKLACQQSCPADAIVFGDLNDPDSDISKKIKDPRYYRAIEELGISPRVGYMTKVRNKDKKNKKDKV